MGCNCEDRKIEILDDCVVCNQCQVVICKKNKINTAKNKINNLKVFLRNLHHINHLQINSLYEEIKNIIFKEFLKSKKINDFKTYFQLADKSDLKKFLKLKKIYDFNTYFQLSNKINNIDFRLSPTDKVNIKDIFLNYNNYIQVNYKKFSAFKNRKNGIKGLSCKCIVPMILKYLNIETGIKVEYDESFKRFMKHIKWYSLDDIFNLQKISPI